MTYSRHSTVEDFALDPRFRKWILDPEQEDHEYWDSWLKEHPDFKITLQQARVLVLNTPNLSFEWEKSAQEHLWDKINAQIDQAPEEANGAQTYFLNSESILYNSEEPEKANRLDYKWLLRIAAVLLIGLVCWSAYNSEAEEQAPQYAWVVKKNPWGQKSTIYLNDGTQVTLNSGSTLRFQKPFPADGRQIWLEGEAYFNVAKDSLRPFTVHSGGIQTVALGTEFNVAAYEPENIQVSLTEGKVSVTAPDQKQEILLPGDAAVYQSSELAKTNFDEEKVLAWKNSILMFDKAGEAEVMKKLEQWYGVEILLSNQTTKKWKYTGRFKKQSLEDVLMSVGFAMDFKYKIDQDKITITYQ